MKPQHTLILGLIISLVCTAAMAASPRFSGASDSVTQKPAAEAASVDGAEGNPDKPEAKSSTAAENGGISVEAQTTTTTNGSVKNAEVKSVPTNEKKSGSWFSNLFRKRNTTVPETTTRKQTAALVNTEEHYEEPYELLRLADLHRYEAGFTEAWRVQASNVMCSLTQQVPNYGRVEFREGVGQPLEFAMYVSHPPAGSGKVHVRSEASRWQHYVRDRDLGYLELEDSDRAVTASTEWSRRLILELSEGMQPILSYWDPADGSGDIEILLSAIRFREGLDLFHRCLGQLLRYDFKKVQVNVVHFHPDSSKLRKQTSEQLDEVVETLKADKGITQINLEIYTQRDGLERYNFRLATRRAQAVRDYLIKHGIKEDMLFIKIHTKSKSQLTESGYKDSDVYISLQRDTAK